MHLGQGLQISLWVFDADNVDISHVIIGVVLVWLSKFYFSYS